MSIDKEKIPTYKYAVSNRIDEPYKESPLVFMDRIQDALDSACDSQKLSIHDKPCTKNIKNQFMIDIIDAMGCLTNDVVEHYSLKGIANELKTTDILDCLELSVVVDHNLNNDLENTTDEEDFS
jgi:hypothetical protein